MGRLLDCGRCEIASPDETWLFAVVGYVSVSGISGEFRINVLSEA